MHAAATAQFEAGRASAQDPLQAEVELDAHGARHRRPRLAARRRHRANERAPASRPRASLAAAAEGAAGAGRRGRRPRLDGLESEAIDRRPDIAGARQRARAEEARAERAERESYPDVTVSTSYNSMWDMPEHRWMVGLGFNLPIQAGRRRGAVDEANAMRAQYESEAARMSDMARTQVFVALQAARGVRATSSTSSRSVSCRSRASRSMRRARRSSRRGCPSSAVVDAEKNLRGVELDQQMAQAECDRRRGELDRALGRIPGLDGKEDAR